MYDTAQNDQFPPGAQAYAAYVDGSLGNQPNYAYIVNTFPKAQHLAIALFASDNADALDVEPGASVPSDVPGWYERQVARGIYRPCIYASASNMETEVLPTLSQAGIARTSVRLWTAHYGVGEHICGPDSCGALGVNADGTQWTSDALGLVLDQSLLLDNFFAAKPASAQPTWETELQSGQLNNGKSAVTAIPLPPGSALRIIFGADTGLQNQPPARLRVALYNGKKWTTSEVEVQTSTGLTVVPFPDPATTSVISVRRDDAGLVSVGYVVY